MKTKNKTKNKNKNKDKKTGCPRKKQTKKGKWREYDACSLVFLFFVCAKAQFLHRHPKMNGKPEKLKYFLPFWIEALHYKNTRTCGEFY
jgi:hypothetical protein